MVATIDRRYAGPRLACVISSRGGDGVTALTSAGDEVFVVRWFSQHVEVYDADTFTLRRQITVRRLHISWGIAACAFHRCLYVSDSSLHCVHRVELTGGDAVTQWSVASDPRGLSVNRQRNVVVACCRVNRLQEYTTDGTLVREICPQGVTRPWHAVQQSTDDYVVSQWKSPGDVSVVGPDGQLLRSHRTLPSAELKHPRSVVVTKSDEFLVADAVDGRICASSGQLLSPPVDDGVERIEGLCLDEPRRRLYVGEFGGQNRLLVYEVILL